MKMVYIGYCKDYDDRDYQSLYSGMQMLPEVYIDFETGGIYVETIYGDLKPVDELKLKIVYVGSCTDSHDVFQTHIDDNGENDMFLSCYGTY